MQTLLLPSEPGMVKILSRESPRAAWGLSSAPPLLVARLQSHALASSSVAVAASAWGWPRRPSGSTPAAFGACSGARLRSSSSRPCRGSLQVVAASDSPYSPYEWHESEYYHVGLQMVQTSGPIGMGPQQGYFLFMRVSEQDMVEDSEHGLIMSVGGDTLGGVAQLAQGLPTGTAGSRPLSLDLLWQVLERGQEISKRTWGILRVAVVEVRDNTFVGRVFFGDPASGVVAWDCDCRPSDACWLALKAKAPIFVNKAVWAHSAMMLRDIQREAEHRQAEAALRDKTQEMLRTAEAMGDDMAGGGLLTPTAIMTTPRAADPEPLKRLKMEMRVALKDEDYATAARIRDHPWMRLHLSLLQALQEGDAEEAKRCEAQLADAISQHELEERQGGWQRKAGNQRRRQHDSGASGGASDEQRGPGQQFN